ncbi:MAG: hypothetical protein ABW000_09375 [Actinoplanes sp.]
MTIFSNWWTRPIPRSRAITSLVLMILAIGLHVWAILDHVYGNGVSVALGWVVVALFTIAGVRVIAGLATNRYPR